MARLIDADRLKVVLEKNFGHTGGAKVLSQLIDMQPTIEAEPVRHGEWKHLVRNKFECTACGRASYVETVMGVPSYERCPHCGANMDGGKHERLKTHYRAEIKQYERAINRLIKVLVINKIALAKSRGIWGMERFVPTEEEWKEWAFKDGKKID